MDAYNVLHRGPEPAIQPELEGVEVIGLRTRLRALSLLFTHQLGRPVIHARRIRRILADGRFDVINFHNISLVGGPGLFSFGKALKLYMAHEHWLVCPMHVLWRHNRELCTGRQCLRCTLHYRRPPQLWRYMGLLEHQLRHVDTFIALSEFSRDKHKEFGFPWEMEVLPPFVPDLEARDAAIEGKRPYDRPYFLFVGRLEQIKGLQDVIPLFRAYADADLLIAGDGDYTTTLKTLTLGLERVKFLGRLDPEELNCYYRHAIALIVPSVCYETFGIVLIEAFKQSTPVIARRLGAFPEVVEQSGGGELFSTRDELLQAMHRIQSDLLYRERLGAAGYQAYRDHYCESVVVPRYLDIVRRTAIRRNHLHVTAILAGLEGRQSSPWEQRCNGASSDLFA
jgi:glycosyltransferase involved in cell wall biosynthesis